MEIEREAERARASMRSPHLDSVALRNAIRCCEQAVAEPNPVHRAIWERQILEHLQDHNRSRTFHIFPT
jgi:hypothetical protein